MKDAVVGCCPSAEDVVVKETVTTTSSAMSAIAAPEYPTILFGIYLIVV